MHIQRVNAYIELRDLRASLLNTFSQWRNHPFCSKEARAVFN
jgi:hypothetical protein